jgi:hypothetical protein
VEGDEIGVVEPETDNVSFAQFAVVDPDAVHEDTGAARGLQCGAVSCILASEGRCDCAIAPRRRATSRECESGVRTAIFQIAVRTEKNSTISAASSAHQRNHGVSRNCDAERAVD